MIYIGIDPGKNGGIAMIEDEFIMVRPLFRRDLN